MSTTTNRETASAYSGVKDQRGTVLELAAGEVDKGASISFLSQYPGEAEFLLPPLSCLEVPSPPPPLPCREALLARAGARAASIIGTCRLSSSRELLAS